jgi:hypothetical protein
MTNKMPKTAIQIILGVFLLTFTAVSCNGGGDKKEPASDTPAVVAPPPMMDTIKKDTPTATTRPIKTPD